MSDSPVLAINLDKGHSIPQEWTDYRIRYQRLYTVLYQWLQAHKEDLRTSGRFGIEQLEATIAQINASPAFTPSPNLQTADDLLEFIGDTLIDHQQRLNSGGL